MEDYEYKVSNLHAILSYDYQQIGNISKTTSKFTRESGSRRFYLGNSSSFGGLRGSELLMPLVRCLNYLLSQVYYRATPLPAGTTDCYRTLPTFYRSFGLSWETPAIKNYHSQDSLYYFFGTTPSAFLGELDSRLLEFH